VRISPAASRTPSSKPGNESCHRGGPGDPGDVCTNGWHRRAHGEQRTGGAEGQRKQRTGAHTGGQARLCFHANHGGCRRLAGARRRQHHLYGSDRNGRRVFPPPVHRGPAARLGAVTEESGHGRRCGMDLEPDAGNIPGSHRNRASLSRSTTPVGSQQQAPSERCGGQTTLGDESSAFLG